MTIDVQISYRQAMMEITLLLLFLLFWCFFSSFPIPIPVTIPSSIAVSAASPTPPVNVVYDCPSTVAATDRSPAEMGPIRPQHFPYGK